jgi:lipopolysaccharide/colanic/teichoic acid biosynthesis glycosyltransferase
MAFAGHRLRELRVMAAQASDKDLCMATRPRAQVKVESMSTAGHQQADKFAAVHRKSSVDTGVVHDTRPLPPLPPVACNTDLAYSRPKSNATSGWAYEPTKRLFDIAVGSILLLIAVPIVLLGALAIWVDSRGSPFFVQTRLGKNGRPFRILKLRGMYADARTRFPGYYDYSKKENLDFCFHHEVDPRVTPAGRFMRKTSIDELPNLWNVLIGDMSLVGPRPEIPEVFALYGPFREEYLSVKPGLTCQSKCTGRDRLTKRETIESDISYIRRRSFALDMRILWLTFRGVILRRDVY